MDSDRTGHNQGYRDSTDASWEASVLEISEIDHRPEHSGAGAELGNRPKDIDALEKTSDGSLEMGSNGVGSHLQPFNARSGSAGVSGIASAGESGEVDHRGEVGGIEKASTLTERDVRPVDLNSGGTGGRGGVGPTSNEREAHLVALISGGTGGTGGRGGRGGVGPTSNEREARLLDLISGGIGGTGGVGEGPTVSFGGVDNEIDEGPLFVYSGIPMPGLSVEDFCSRYDLADSIRLFLRQHRSQYKTMEMLRDARPIDLNGQGLQIEDINSLRRAFEVLFTSADQSGTSGSIVYPPPTEQGTRSDAPNDQINRSDAPRGGFSSRTLRLAQQYLIAPFICTPTLWGESELKARLQDFPICIAINGVLMTAAGIFPSLSTIAANPPVRGLLILSAINALSGCSVSTLLFVHTRKNEKKFEEWFLEQTRITTPSFWTPAVMLYLPLRWMVWAISWFFLALIAFGVVYLVSAVQKMINTESSSILDNRTIAALALVEGIAFMLVFGWNLFHVVKTYHEIRKYEIEAV